MYPEPIKLRKPVILGVMAMAICCACVGFPVKGAMAGVTVKIRSQGAKGLKESDSEEPRRFLDIKKDLWPIYLQFGKSLLVQGCSRIVALTNGLLVASRGSAE